MTTGVDSRRITTALRRAAVRATLAPSVHNTQPWRLELTPDALRIYADPDRRLHVLDPTGRQLTISVGCALFNARAALSAAGLSVRVERLPDPARPELMATLTATEPGPMVLDPIGRLDAVAELRRTNRRRFAPDEVPVEVIDAARRAAAAEDVDVHVIAGEQERVAVAVLSQQADRVQEADPAYRAELRAWTTEDLSRQDGVPAATIPHVDGGSHDEVPIRDFDLIGRGALPSRTESSSRQCLLLLGTAADDGAHWLRTGEALERLMLEITRRGFAISPLTQVVEVAATREALRQELGLWMYPHLLVRIGRAPGTPATPRRRFVDLLTETPD
jgi:nitroreductase